MRYASTITNKSHDKDNPNEIQPHLNINIDKKIMYTTTQNTERRIKEKYLIITAAGSDFCSDHAI